MNDMRAAVEEMNMEKATVEKQNKCLMNDIADANHRHEELQSAIGDADVTKKKLAAEKTDLEKQIADADATVRSLGKLRSSLSTQVRGKGGKEGSGNKEQEGRKGKGKRQRLSRLLFRLLAARP